MGTSRTTAVYRCFNDCSPDGCPGHLLSVNHHRTADVISISIDGEPICDLDVNAFDALRATDAPKKHAKFKASRDA